MNMCECFTKVQLDIQLRKEKYKLVPDKEMEQDLEQGQEQEQEQEQDGKLVEEQEPDLVNSVQLVSRSR